MIFTIRVIRCDSCIQPYFRLEEDDMLQECPNCQASQYMTKREVLEEREYQGTINNLTGELSLKLLKVTSFDDKWVMSCRYQPLDDGPIVHRRPGERVPYNPQVWGRPPLLPILGLISTINRKDRG